MGKQISKEKNTTFGASHLLILGAVTKNLQELQKRFTDNLIKYEN